MTISARVGLVQRHRGKLVRVREAHDEARIGSYRRGEEG